MWQSIGSSIPWLRLWNFTGWTVILDHGHGLGTKALLGMIRLMSRQPVVDAVKLAFYRREFYGAGPLTQEAMRGPSAWTVGERELFAAYVAKKNECEF